MDYETQAIDKTLEQLAQEVVDRFEQRTRADGTEYWCLADGSPSWMPDLCHTAHGEQFPNDVRYRFIWDALSALAAGDDNGDTLVLLCHEGLLKKPFWWIGQAVS
jgi:hypothetical protein